MTQRELENKVADLESAFKTLLAGLGKMGKASAAPPDVSGRITELSQQLINAQSVIEGLQEWKKRTDELLSELSERVGVDSMGGAPAKGATSERASDLTSALKNAHKNGQRGGRGFGMPARNS